MIEKYTSEEFNFRPDVIKLKNISHQIESRIEELMNTFFTQDSTPDQLSKIIPQLELKKLPHVKHSNLGGRQQTSTYA